MTDLRCVLISGHHATGKTGLLRWAQSRISGNGYSWHSESGGKSICTQAPARALEALLPLWCNSAYHTLVIEGTRVYSTVFRAVMEAKDVGRELWTLQLLHSVEVGRVHIRARCTAKGKDYRADFWDAPAAESLFARRYVHAHARYLPWFEEHGVRLGEHEALWVDEHYAVISQAQAWLAKALRFKVLGRAVHL